jgi:amyloid beta precursor protein binding protein 1
LSAYASLSKKQQPNAPLALTVESLTAEAQTLLPPGTTLPEEFEYAVGEVYVSIYSFPLSLFPIEKTFKHSLLSVRAPNADLPNTAAFLGGLVAQETIKMITHQYIPINGFCIIDLVESWTGLL